MRLRVVRFHSDGEATNGALCIDTPQESFAACFTLEDEHRTIKKWGETRIPAGTYEIGLRTHGGFHGRYSKKFGSWHQGMVEILDVPGFTDVLIHIGNDDDDTAGCILLGETSDRNWVGSSTAAYRRIYPIISQALKRGEPVCLEIIDADQRPALRLAS